MVAANLTFNCTFFNFALLGCELFFLFNVNFVVSYKFYAASKDLMEFALHKRLPSERSKKMKRVILASIWAVSFGYFLFYLIYSGILVVKNRINTFLSLNFGCLVLATTLLLLQTFLFCLSFNNIR